MLITSFTLINRQPYGYHHDVQHLFDRQKLASKRDNRPPILQQTNKKKQSEKDNTDNRNVKSRSNRGRGGLIVHISSLIIIRLISLYFDPN